MLNCIKPVPLTVEVSSNHDASLLTSKGLFKFLFSNLEKQNSALSGMPSKEIRNCLLKHWNKDLVFFINYLSNVSCLYGVEKGELFFFDKQKLNSWTSNIINGRTFFFKKKICCNRKNAKKRRCECCCGLLQHEIRNS
jgi:hypothetical protein